MGECGCETDKVARFRAGEGRWLVLEIHPGCTYCGTEWGVGMSEANEADEDEWEWWWADIPVAEFDRIGMWATRLLDTDTLKRLFMESIGETDDLAETPFAMDEFVSRGGMRDAYYQTRRLAKEDEARYRARAATDTGEG